MSRLRVWVSRRHRTIVQSESAGSAIESFVLWFVTRVLMRGLLLVHAATTVANRTPLLWTSADFRF